MMRHPVDRLISHYIHEWSMGVYRCGIEDAVLRYPELVSYGQYVTQLTPYFEVFGQDAVLPVFFDSLISRPQEELERVCRFVGYEERPVWQTNLKPSNSSSERVRAFPFYDLLVRSGPATWLRRNFVPKTWRDSIKNQLTMTKKPELSYSTKEALGKIFDDDLSKLGELVGVSLNCENFRRVTSNRTLDWVVRNA
jgi:hypothetical protein